MLRRPSPSLLCSVWRAGEKGKKIFLSLRKFTSMEEENEEKEENPENMFVPHMTTFGMPNGIRVKREGKAFN